MRNPFQKINRRAALGRKSYSLVLHDDTSYSNGEKFERLLAAHIIYNLLTSERFYISDSQVVGTRNFRNMLRNNDTIKEMVKAHSIVFLTRETWEWHPEYNNDTKDAESHWEAIQNSFIRNEKMRTSHNFYSVKDDLKFLNDHAKTEEWRYQDISNNFSDRLYESLTSNFARAKLGELVYTEVCDIANQEIAKKPKDDRLGATFAEKKLVQALQKKGIPLVGQQIQFLKDCYKGHYAKNLPDAMGLLPHYTDDLAGAFDIMRGFKLEWSEPETTTIKERSLKSEFIVEGLLRLTPDDIERVRRGHAFRRFNELSVNDNDKVKAASEIALAYGELCTDINERIVNRLGLPASLISEDNALQSKVRWLKSDTGTGLIGEAVSIGMGYALGPVLDVSSIPLIGFIAQQIFGEIKRRCGTDDRSMGRRDVHIIDEALLQHSETYKEKISHEEHLDPTAGNRKISEVLLNAA